MHDIFYFTDIHGMYDLYRAIMNYCQEQDPEATIIFGGDACDRGPNGYKIMKELLDNPYVVYLKGNHEEMFCKAAREAIASFYLDNINTQEAKEILYATMVFDYRYKYIKSAIHNNGIDTLIDWINDGAPMEIIERLERLPLTFSTDTCDFCHAGGNPQVFQRVAENEYNNEPVDEYLYAHILWDRIHLENIWDNNKICIFGHTPTLILPELTNIKLDDTLDPQPIKLAHDTKIDMDTGAVFRGVAWVLNILTMEAQGFEDIDITNKKIHQHEVKKIYSIQM